MGKFHIYMQILQGNVLFSGKFYTVGNIFTRPLVVTVATNFKAALGVLVQWNNVFLIFFHLSITRVLSYYFILSFIIGFPSFFLFLYLYSYPTYMVRHWERLMIYWEEKRGHLGEARGAQQAFQNIFVWRSCSLWAFQRLCFIISAYVISLRL